MPDKAPRTKCKLPAIHCAYQAVLQIGFVESEYFPADRGYSRAREIANEALKHLNSEHTAEIQKAVFKMKGVK